MNLFWLSKSHRRNAKYHADKHIVKMPLEAVQLLYSVLWILNPDQSWKEEAPTTKSGQKGYKLTHRNHPLALWVRESSANYLLCCEYALALCKEYTWRYGKIHAVEKHALWLKENIPQTFTCSVETPVPLCTGRVPIKKAKNIKSAVRHYRRYYITDKTSIAVYKYRERPKWFKQMKRK